MEYLTVTMPYNRKEASVKLIRKTSRCFAQGQSNDLLLITSVIISPKAVEIKNTEAIEIKNTEAVEIKNSEAVEFNNTGAFEIKNS